MGPFAVSALSHTSRLFSEQLPFSSQSLLELLPLDVLMECELCGIPGRKKFFCEACLTERLLIHNSSLKRLSAAHRVTLQKAAQLIEAPGGLQERRVLKSRRAALIISLRSLEAGRARSLEHSESLKNFVAKKQKELAIRQSRLHAARSQLRDRRSALDLHPSELVGGAFCPLQPKGPASNLHQQIATVLQEWDQVSQQLVHVREKLIMQLCKIYTITVNQPKQHSNVRLEAQPPSAPQHIPKSSSPPD
ncbi:hypothetical protein VP01_376g9 [Puccinia sorghi]|uniref:Autophagy-related protein 14 n=1 Tax=Puccinia sorghi TaxID=27349 RepID=A0A0L6UTQ2_9BASI|nr:hypothetical protein VP01_376g9 [Puccinia sorghi]